MPFSSGTFSVVYNWTTESGAPPIEIAKLDTQHADFATGLSNCILRDGSGLPTAAIPWNSQNLTGVAQLEAARFVPTGSTVPSNGMYLSAANTVAWATNTTLRGSVNATGNWTIAAPSSGSTAALTVNSQTGSVTGIRVTDGANYAVLLKQKGASTAFVGAEAGFAFAIGANDEADLSITTGGNVTINAPSSGAALTVVNNIGANHLLLTDGTRQLQAQSDSSNFYFGTASNHQLVLLSNNANRILVGNAGNVTINAPSSGTALTVNQASGLFCAGFAAGSGDTARVEIAGNDATVGTGSFALLQDTSSVARLFNRANAAMDFSTNGTQRVNIAAAGNVTINAPSSGTTLSVSAGTGLVAQQWSDGTVTGQATFSGTALSIGTTSAHSYGILTNGSGRVVVNSAGNVTINAPSSGVALAVSGVSGTHSLTLADAGGTGGFKAGYLNIPQNSQSANYTLVLADAGKQILHPSGAGAGDTFTIPANSSVAYDVGTVITFVNLDTNAVSIAITTDTLTIAGTSTTGTRTLAQNGYATAIKVTSTSWLISGVGLS